MAGRIKVPLTSKPGKVLELDFENEAPNNMNQFLTVLKNE